MNTKSLLIISAIAITTVGIASAKSYSFNLINPTKVGSAELRPGAYDVKVQGSEAVFTNDDSGKSFTIPVKIGQNDKKFGTTSVDINNKNGVDSIEEIDLGGSNTKLEFGQ
jgi:hypothetical protein